MKRSKIFRTIASAAPLKLVLSLYYHEHFGRWINWKKPQGFNAKEQWLKLNYRNPLMSVCADKFRVREYVTERIGTTVLNELYGVYESPDEIAFETLPESFVLRVNHGCGYNIIVPNKKSLDITETKRRLARWLSINYHKLSREWHYKNIPRRIVAEKYLEETGGLKDYKIYCFNGIPKYILVIFGRDSGDIAESIYDTEWRMQDFTRHHKLYPHTIPKPSSLKKMLEAATVLASGFPFVRVDMYNPESKVIFGEMTFHPGNGVNQFKPPEADLLWGNLLDLKKIPKEHLRG